MTLVLKDRRVTKRVSRIKNSITHFHGFVEFETPHAEGWRVVVAHKERTLEAMVVEGCVLHELYFLEEDAQCNSCRKHVDLDPG